MPTDKEREGVPWTGGCRKKRCVLQLDHSGPCKRPRRADMRTRATPRRCHAGQVLLRRRAARSGACVARSGHLAWCIPLRTL